MAGNPRLKIAFVATNSLTQGEQVAQLWPLLFRRGLEIAFAHRTFEWTSEARGKAHVHCVILGLAHRDSLLNRRKRLFSYPSIKGPPIETPHDWLSPYLVPVREAQRHLVVKEEARPINGTRPVRFGTQPIDGGHLILSPQEQTALLKAVPTARHYVKPFVGSDEYINGRARFILDLADAPPMVLSEPELKVRLSGVVTARLASKRPATRDLAKTPTKFAFRTVPSAPFLILPGVSSERRDYAPIGWAEPPTIPSNLVNVLPDATLWDFAILTSAMHMAWLRHIGGRLESRYRYSIGLVYNTFPWPEAVTPAARARVEALAQGILDARAAPKNATASLAQLYKPLTMPADLRAAHVALDRAVDRLYRATPFTGDADRVEHLLTRYELLVNSLGAAPAANRRTARRRQARVSG